MTGPFLPTAPGTTLTEAIVAEFVRRIDDRLLRAGARLPSIRAFAAEQGVSRFTAVEAYDRLVARGYVESRRGSGFYVRPRPERAPPDARAWADAPAPSVDVVWLLRNMFRRLPARDMPGGGVLPPDWLDESLVGSGLRSLARDSARAFLDYGEPQGWAPLREQLARRLSDVGVAAEPSQVVTTLGVTQGLDLVAQHLLRPGDTVLVDEPSWFLMFGRFAQLGARIVGVPRHPDGPDVGALARLAAEHRPKLFVTVSVLHNPTSTSMSAARAHEVLRVAEQHDFVIAEDDVYGDLHPGPSLGPVVRLAALDQLRRVILLGSFSKTLAANLRVGWLAASPERVRALTDLKMLVGLTSPEAGERIVHRVLHDGRYRRHVDRLRGRLARAREGTLRALERLGLVPLAAPGGGMFVWADAGRDTNPLAQAMLEQGFLLAPGSLFLPDQRPSPWLRFNVATSTAPRMLHALDQALQRGT